MLGAYGWAAQALELPAGAAEVEVATGVEDVVWAAARVKPAARTKAVSCMVYSGKMVAIGLERVYIGYERNNISSEKRTFAGSREEESLGKLDGTNCK